MYSAHGPLINFLRSTTVATITSTAYLDNSGNTIFFGKRDALPTALAKRAITSTNNNTVPFQLQGFSRSDLLTLCNCNGFTKPLSTIIRTMAARPSVGTSTYLYLPLPSFYDWVTLS
jgi:hypothetical protein